MYLLTVRLFCVISVLSENVYNVISSRTTDTKPLRCNVQGIRSFKVIRNAIDKNVEQKNVNKTHFKCEFNFEFLMLMSAK